jgi:hypothetical protein
MLTGLEHDGKIFSCLKKYVFMGFKQILMVEIVCTGF